MSQQDSNDGSKLRRGDGETSPIESLKRTLDTPTSDVSRSFERHGFHHETPEAPTDWDDTEGAADTAVVSDAAPASVTQSIMKKPRISKRHHTIAKWIFALATLFFLVALGVAAFFLTGNRNILSTDKIDITVTGPTTISAGQIVPLAIEIVNNNATTLEVADLLIEYPRGTRSAEDVTKEMLRVRLSLGNIAPGERLATTTKAIIFGEEKTQQDIVVSLEYRVAGSNAIFVKERLFAVEIDDSPVAISVKAPSSVNSGDQINLELVIRSNSTAPMKNVVVKARYPFGFTFTSSSPDAVFGETVWSIGDIEPEGERTLIVRGTIEGQNDEDRIFNFELGVGGDGGDVSDIGTAFAGAEHLVRIVRPFVDLGLAVGGQQGDTFGISADGTATLDITWRNNLSNTLSDVVLELSIEGTGIDERTISSGSGTYNSQRNIMTFDKRSLPALGLLDAGAGGRASVSFRALKNSELAGTVVNPQVTLNLTMRGVPVGVRDVPEQIRASTNATVKVITDAFVKQSVYHNDGPISNSGPIPPRAETETTYTIVWEASNTVNDITGARVSSRLPPYVSWKGVISPLDEDITFNQSTGDIEWRIGTLRAGAGFKTEPRTVAFQVGFIPSVTQIGNEPVLINQTILRGTDGFTSVSVQATDRDHTTKLDEPGHGNDSGEVRN